MEDKLALITENSKEFLKFLKSRYLLIHQSNVFFRDIHYGVMAYLELNRRRYRYIEAEELAHDVIASLVKSDILKSVDNKTWLLNYPEFKLVSKQPAVAAKPAASRPAGAVTANPTAPLAKPAVPAAAPAAPRASDAPTQPV